MDDSNHEKQMFVYYLCVVLLYSKSCNRFQIKFKKC